MTPIEVIVKIYDECVVQLHRAVKFIEDKNFSEAHNSLYASGELVNALREVLDKEAGGEIATNLDALYAFFYRQITQADTKKDVELIKQIIPQITELQDAFTQLSKMPRDMNSHGDVRTGMSG
jgi:flagellar protein FliS